MLLIRTDVLAGKLLFGASHLLEVWNQRSHMCHCESGCLNSMRFSEQRSWKAAEMAGTKGTQISELALKTSKVSRGAVLWWLKMQVQGHYIHSNSFKLKQTCLVWMYQHKWSDLFTQMCPQTGFRAGRALQVGTWLAVVNYRSPICFRYRQSVLYMIRKTLLKGWPKKGNTHWNLG